MTGGTPVPTTARLGSSSGCSASATLRPDLRIHVPDRRKVGRPRPRVQLADERVVARLGLQPRNAAPRIVQVAEDDGVGGAGLLARGLDLAVGDRPVAFL